MIGNKEFVTRRSPTIRKKLVLKTFGPPTSNVFTRAQQSKNRQVWVEALRSVQYRAPLYFEYPRKRLLKLRLQSGLELYSAMGVLAEISGLGEWQPLTDDRRVSYHQSTAYICNGQIVRQQLSDDEDQQLCYRAPGMFSEGYIPQLVMDWVGLLTPYGSYRRQGKSRPLKIALSLEIRTLEEVADIVEAEPRGLFDIPGSRPFPLSPEGLENYRARSRASHIVKKYRASVLEAADYTCFYCSQKCVPGLMEIDHYIPLDLGGSTEVENLRASCKPCNARKRNRMPAPELLESLKREAIANLEYEEKSKNRYTFRNTHPLRRFYLSNKS